jgi:hypothetical protein
LLDYGTEMRIRKALEVSNSTTKRGVVGSQKTDMQPRHVPGRIRNRRETRSLATVQAPGVQKTRTTAENEQNRESKGRPLRART